MTFRELCRQNTGKSLCDSGDYYGRQYEKPISEAPIKLYKDTVTISLPHWLEANLTIDEELLEICENSEGYWAEEILEDVGIEKFSEIVGVELGKICTLNTYNSENDFDQDFQFTILSDSDDWYYSDNTVILLQTHNGCDIRGGYSTTVPCRLVGEDFLDWVVEIDLYIDEERIENDTYSAGYSQHPSYQFFNDFEIVEVCESHYIVTDGEQTYKAYPSFRGY
jgi:hypothetical protein